MTKFSEIIYFVVIKINLIIWINYYNLINFINYGNNVDEIRVFNRDFKNL